MFHNIGQLIAAMVVVETFSAAYYMPALLVAGAATGFLIGAAADGMLKRLKNLWQ